MNAPARSLEVLDAEPRALTVTTPGDLLAIAVQKGATVEQMSQLLALQERYEANEARKAFTVAMTAFKAEPLNVFKRQTVDFSSAKGRTHYKHANLADVTAVVGPAMSKHGLSYRWEVKQDAKMVTVACVVTHARGHSERVEMSGPLDDSGNKNPIQQAGSTVQYLERYTLLAVSGLSTQNEHDDDGRSGAGGGQERDAEGDSKKLVEGQAAAMEGMKSLTAWWGALTAKDRAGLNKQYPSLRKAAEAADADR